MGNQCINGGCIAYLPASPHNSNADTPADFGLGANEALVWKFLMNTFWDNRLSRKVTSVIFKSMLARILPLEEACCYAAHADVSFG